MQTLIEGPESTEAFAAAMAAHERARRVGGMRQRHYRLADRVVRVCIVGRGLADELSAPLEHLRTDDAEPFLTIDVWDEAETGVPCPRAEAPDQLGTYGMMTASADGRFVAEYRPHSAAWLDRQNRRIVVGIESVGRLHLDERARPFHRVLAVSLGDAGIQFVHAGLVASEGRGALFVGMGGSGKSTSSICCCLDGLTYLGDDFVGLDAGGGGRFLGYSLYNSALIGLGHMRRYQALPSICRPGHYDFEEKSVACFGQLEPCRFASQVEICAVVLPRVVARETTSFEPAAARDALLALAPSSLLYLPAVGPRSMQRLGALVGRVPSFWLELGSDVRQIAPQVRALLARSGG